MLPKDWLTEQLTIAAAESRNTAGGIPFGFDHDKWRALVARMLPEDELWSFSSPPESWRARCGRAGIAVVRNGETVDYLTTMLN